MNYVVSFYTGTYISVNPSIIIGKWCLSVFHSGRYYWKSKDYRLVRSEEQRVLVNFVARGGGRKLDNKIFLNIVTLFIQFEIACQINCFNIITYISCLYTCMMYMYIMRIQFRDHFLLKGKLVLSGTVCLVLTSGAFNSFTCHGYEKNNLLPVVWPR